MSSHTVSRGLRASTLALILTGAVSSTFAGAARADSQGLVDRAAAQLAARSDVFAATTAGINVVPMHMAGSCPRSFMLQVDLGARAPGTLSYRIETLDGRTSQLFEARSGAREDGLFGTRAEHSVDLAKLEEGEAGPTPVRFSAPTRPAAEPQPEPDFFERLFGTAAEQDPSKGLREQSFRVRVVAPNEIVSAFDRVSISCDDEELRRQAEIAESQRDGGNRDRGDRDRGDRDRGRDSGRGSAGSGTPGGGPVD